MNTKERYLCQVSDDELRKALTDMLKSLNVKAGSISGWYNIYNAVFKEKKKAVLKCNIRDHDFHDKEKI